MHVMKRCGAIALGVLLASSSLQAQDVPTVEIRKENSGAGTTSAEFLLLGAGARGMALGPAFSALVRDVEALYYNPASLSLMEGPEAMLSIMPYFANTNYLWAGVALPLAGGEYGFGLSIANFGFSNQPVYTEWDQEGAEELTYGVSETVFGLSFAHSFIDRFSGGVTLKLISDQLGQTSAFGAAIDVGTNYHTELAGRPISMSFVIQNLGTSLKHSGAGTDLRAFPQSPDETFPVQALDPTPARFETANSPIPVVFRVGVAYDLISSAANRLSLLGEFNEHYNNSPAFGFASEYAWTPQDAPIAASLRGSYAYQPDNRLTTAEERDFAGRTTVDNQALDGLTLGAGLQYRIAGYEVRADYAWRHFGVLGARNVFTVGLNWR